MTATTIVRKATITSQANRPVWAWCLLNDKGVGVHSIQLTDPSGMEPVEMPDDMNLGYHELVFTFTHGPANEIVHVPGQGV